MLESVSSQQGPASRMRLRPSAVLGLKGGRELACQEEPGSKEQNLNSVPELERKCA